MHYKRDTNVIKNPESSSFSISSYKNYGDDSDYDYGRHWQDEITD